ncbi:hypothetical protein [Flavobacterium sp. KJJ]|uniref:hypothetical protein n=1 Tax=Flavobacterium sp. KJJ TaxID=1270193 RepID=UPI0012FCE20F|nr:hypothetical protein [Flavobacterium sp. KJJ]
MKNFIYLSIIGLLFTACGSGGDDPVTPPVVNKAPSVPVLTAPADNKLCLDNVVSFQWNESTDTEKDAIVYQIQVAKDNAFSQIITTLDNTSNPTNISLEKNTSYYWRVKATDAKGLASAYTATYKFYTAGTAVVNHLPFLPTLGLPAINSVLTASTATLSWTASDVDTGDVLTYDVYFGTANPPTVKIGENISAVNVTTAVEPTKQYFWKVVVKDNKGGETIGQVWKFKTN